MIVASALAKSSDATSDWYLSSIALITVSAVTFFSLPKSYFVGYRKPSRESFCALARKAYRAE